MFSFTVGHLTVYEGSTAFYLSNGEREVCLGDGVDMFCKRDGQSIPVGAAPFYDHLKKWLSECFNGICEEYGL